MINVMLFCTENILNANFRYQFSQDPELYTMCNSTPDVYVYAHRR